MTPSAAQLWSQISTEGHRIEKASGLKLHQLRDIVREANLIACPPPRSVHGHRLQRPLEKSDHLSLLPGCQHLQANYKLEIELW